MVRALAAAAEEAEVRLAGAVERGAAEAAALEDPEADREARQAQMRAESSADLLALLAGEEDVPADFAELVTTAHEAREQAR